MSRIRPLVFSFIEKIKVLFFTRYIDRKSHHVTITGSIMTGQWHEQHEICPIHEVSIGNTTLGMDEAWTERESLLFKSPIDPNLFKYHQRKNIHHSRDKHGSRLRFSWVNEKNTVKNSMSGLQYVAPGPDEKDANVYFLPQKNSSELKFVLQFTVTFP